MADSFSHNVQGFKPTCCDLVEHFGLLDRTADHLYICHCLQEWSDTKKFDFLINMFSEAGQAWMLAPGAAQIITVFVVGDYSSTHMPEEGPAREISAVHAVGKGLWLTMIARNWATSSPTAHIVLRVQAGRARNCDIGLQLTERSTLAHQHQGARYDVRN